MKKRIRLAACLGALLLCGASVLTSCASNHGLSAKSPVTITVWHYYNGAQKQTFDRLVAEFNMTVGAERGIIVDASSKGNVNDLIAHTLDAINHKVGADNVPNIIAAYADTALEIDSRGLAADISAYLSDESVAQYLPAYIEEGRFSGDGSLKLFPVAKSTEVFMLNKTDWDTFAAATGARPDSFATWEGLADVARQYYEWTDGLTPDVPHDGKAFFGRDAMANYMIIGSLQLGHELFSVTDGEVTFNIDEDAMYRLWENYYIPYVNGWYVASGRFRSDDMKTGDLVALVGSTSGVTYFPTAVTRDDGTTYPIESEVFALPNFAGTDPYAVQQGAGMLVTKSDETHEFASVVFLQWFTSTQNNLMYCVESGYLPVTVDGNTEVSLYDTFELYDEPVPRLVQDVLLAGVFTTQNYTMYTNHAFAQGSAARQVVETSLHDRCVADRAAVEERLARGMTQEEAVAPYVTRESFEAWLLEFRTALNALL